MELYQENALVAASEGMQDPSYELEREETFADCVNTIVHLIETLPRCQQDAMICALKDQREETFPVLDALKDQQVDIEARQWPEQKAATQRLRSSLCVARKKMRILYNASVHQASAR